MENLSTLPIKQLQERCKALNKPAYGTKAQLIERIHASKNRETSQDIEASQGSNNSNQLEYDTSTYASYSLKQLQELCQTHRISKHGKKDVLKARLNRYFTTVQNNNKQQQAQLDLIQSIENQLINNDDTDNDIEFNFVDIPEHPTSHNQDIAEPPSKRFRRLGASYERDETDYSTLDDAKQKILNERAWKYGTNQKTSEGQKQYFNCIHKKCPVRIYILYDQPDE
jgi:hypothetical protein